MNLAVIRRVTRALADVVKLRTATNDAPQYSVSAILGFDGRLDSERFAREAVGVLSAAGVSVKFFDVAVPTPVVAFAAQRLSASAAVVVTASHNPPEYNGYKVYGSDAIQIVPPFDLEVSQRLSALGAANQIPCDASGASRLDATVGDEYVEAVVQGRASGAIAAPLRIAYTPLHGVGAAWMQRVLERAGYSDLVIEPSQHRVDGTFPTVRFPNPEEPATLALGVALARKTNAAVLLVNDPDADRMGAAIPTHDGSFRILSGNEIGVVLTDYLLSHCETPERALVASTIVSSPMGAKVAESYGAHHEVTLTGFKWLWTACKTLVERSQMKFVICWEEALGYSTHSAVRDKDGIAAGLVLADWVSECHRRGTTPIERLAALYRRHGAWGSAQRNVVRAPASGVEEIARMMEFLAREPPDALLGRRLQQIRDFSQNAAARPLWCGAASMQVLEFEGGARVVVRPSGTEPKLKCYADVELPVQRGEDPLEVYARAKTNADALNAALVERLEMVLSTAR
jgi:phosphomannomutase